VVPCISGVSCPKKNRPPHCFRKALGKSKAIETIKTIDFLEDSRINAGLEPLRIGRSKLKINVNRV
jgi:hypothetical protein